MSDFGPADSLTLRSLGLLCLKLSDLFVSSSFAVTCFFSISFDLSWSLRRPFYMRSRIPPCFSAVSCEGCIATLLYRSMISYSYSDIVFSFLHSSWVKSLSFGYSLWVCCSLLIVVYWFSSWQASSCSSTSPSSCFGFTFDCNSVEEVTLNSTSAGPLRPGVVGVDAVGISSFI